MNDIYKSSEGAALIRERYEALLPLWPVPFQRLSVPTREGGTSVIVSGDRALPPLLLFHGSMSNSLMWMGDVPAWSEHYCVHAVDLIGEPGMSAPARPDENSEGHALWLDDVIDGLSIRNPAMVGISLGGWLALDYAIRRPGAVSQLAVMCPAGVGRQRQSFMFKALLYLMLGEWGRNRLRAQVFGQSASELSEEAKLYAEYLSLIQRNFKPRIVRFRRFTDEMLHSLEMPLLAIVGAGDVFFDAREIQRRLERHVPRAQVIFHEEMGHMITGQTDPILRFLLGR